MTSPLQTLIQCGTKLWLDSIDPGLVQVNRALGATGATSNPIIVSDIIRSGRFDQDVARLSDLQLTDTEIAWQLTDLLVRQAQDVFLPVWETTKGDDGYVSFELDPLLEDPVLNLPHSERVQQYIALGKYWSRGHKNRMIKVPATSAGIDSLEELAASGVPLNVTLIFTASQYRQASAAIWRGAQKLSSRRSFKSVYSLFVSRIDVYTAKHVPELSYAAQGQTGIAIAKRIWRENQDFWKDKNLPLRQEIVFASTGTKDPNEDPGKYVLAFAGSDIETNPPATNDAVESSGRVITRAVDRMPAEEILAEIDSKVDLEKLEAVLMKEGIFKFADPQKGLLSLISRMRTAARTIQAH
ncbi:MAG: transaldolase [Acidobacteria bacterium RIFCSPLOWO2_12_FULL_54_10]|nr:MAG: transaldolase [Acidobacteria bacterium RIFCSPLOWO2_12_FULL_54_10]